MKARTLIPTTLVPLLAFAGGVTAEETTLNCRLYIAESTESLSSHESAETETMLTALRRGGVCVFADGSVADKQFVMIQHIADGGAAGRSRGYSIYTFEDGDTLTLSFDGGWDEGGFAADYDVLSGTGAYEGASGVGTITGVQSPWQGTGTVDIEIDVATADS